MKVYKTEVLANVRDRLGNQTLSDTIPMETGNNIVPVVDVGFTRSNFCKYASNTATANLTIFTSSTIKDTYITAIHLALQKDVTCDMTSFYLDFYPENSPIQFIILPINTLTASSFSIDISFPYPFKIAKNTVMRIVAPFGAGTATKTATIWGFEVEKV